MLVPSSCRTLPLWVLTNLFPATAMPKAWVLDPELELELLEWAPELELLELLERVPELEPLELPDRAVPPELEVELLAEVLAVPELELPPAVLVPLELDPPELELLEGGSD
jgi:hypothetical protein